MKRCPTCQLSKPFQDFNKRKSKKDGLDYQCRKCSSDSSIRRRRIPTWPTVKRCTKCAKVKALDSFCALSKKERVKLRSVCKSCVNARRNSLYSPVKAKQRREKREASCPNDRIVRAATRLRRNYGLTIEKRDEMILNQGGRCAMCDEECRLVVDHDHATGKVRALLCNSCNSAIGYLKDSPKLAMTAAAYLTKHAKRVV